MTKANVAELCLAVWQCERLRLELDHQYKQMLDSYRLSNMSVPDRQNLYTYLSNYERAIEELGLHAAEDRLNKVRSCHTDPAATIRQMCTELRVLEEATIDELKRHAFIHIPTDKFKVYSRPSEFFGPSFQAYPSAQENMTSACNCYAIGENTASVFHSMGVLQTGLITLANELKVSFPNLTTDMQNWQNIIDHIQSELAKQTTALAQHVKSAMRDAMLKAYSTAAIQFRYFKDAWRNHVAHFQQIYGPDEAYTVLVHVKDFMVELSSVLKEPL